MADVITPNLTEAHLLLGEDYRSAPRSPAQVRDMLSALLDLGPENALITSMPVENGLANVCMRRGDAGYYQCAYPMLPVQYPGTGDLFASVLSRAMDRGDDLQSARTGQPRGLSGGEGYLCPGHRDPRRGFSWNSRAERHMGRFGRRPGLNLLLYKYSGKMKHSFPGQRAGFFDTLCFLCGTPGA